MKRVLESLIILTLVPTPSAVLADWIDTFNGGLQQSWTFLDDGGATTFSAGEVGNVLRLEDTTSVSGGGSSFGFGTVDTEVFTDVLVSGTLNPNNSAATNSRLSLLARIDPVLGTGYGLSIRYRRATGVVNGTVRISRFDAFSRTVLAASTALVPISLTDSFFLDFSLSGSNITGRVFDQLGGTLLASLSATDSAYGSGRSGALVESIIEASPLFGEFDNISSLAVPEPSTLTLLAIGAFGMAFYGCRLNRKKRRAA